MEEHPDAEVERYPTTADVEQLKRLYRQRNQLPDDEEVSAVVSDQGVFLYRPGSFIRLEGGTLEMSSFRIRRLRWRVRLRRAWAWCRYRWRTP